MALGNSKPRNWGKDVQEGRLRIALNRLKVAFKVERGFLYLAPSAKGITLPFASVASLHNTQRGRWEAWSVFDDTVIGRGISQRDCIRATVEAVWK